MMCMGNGCFDWLETTSMESRSLDRCSLKSYRHELPTYGSLNGTILVDSSLRHRHGVNRGFGSASTIGIRKQKKSLRKTRPRSFKRTLEWRSAPRQPTECNYAAMENRTPGSEGGAASAVPYPYPPTPINRTSMA